MKIRVSKIKRRWLRRLAIVVSFPVACLYSLAWAFGLWLGLVALAVFAEPVRRFMQWIVVVCDTIETAQEQWK